MSTQTPPRQPPTRTGCAADDPIALVARKRGTVTFSAELTRGHDQTRLRYEFVDLVLVDDELVATGPDAEPVVRLVLDPQHTAEQAVAVGDPPPTSPLGSLTAGPTEVAFAVEAPIPFALGALLPDDDWKLIAGAGVGTEGTAIEAPQAVVLAPEAGARVTAHGAEHDGVAELWTLRVAPGPVTVTANTQAVDTLDTRSPDAGERDDLVELTDQVAPVDGRQLWLSLHGSFLDLLGEWDDDGGLDTNVVRWLHRAVAGRDLHVEVTTRGYLVPFGHRAAIVTITERALLDDGLGGGPTTAVLTQEERLSVAQPVLEWGGDRIPDDGRRLPFTQVTAVAWPTGPVARRQITWTDDDGPRDMRDDNAWHVTLAADDGDAVVTYTAVDRVGNDAIGFDAPATFVEHENAFDLNDAAPPANLADYLADDESIDRRTIHLGGADVAWADPVDDGSLATVKATDRIELSLWRWSLDDDDHPTKAELLAEGQPNLFPVVTRAWVVDEAFAATQDQPGEPLEVVPHPRWLEHGNDADRNWDRAFLTIPSSPVFSAGAEGRAVVALDLPTELYNQRSGVATESTGPDVVWDPAAALGDATLLGSISLASLIGEVRLDEAVPGVDIPGLEVTADPGTGVVTTRFTFEPRLHDVPGFVTFGDARAKVEVGAEVDLSGGAPRSWVDAEVRDVALSMPPLAPVVTLNYRRVTVHVPDDGPVDVDHDLRDWQLEDLLAWVQPLLDTLSGLGADARVEIDLERLYVEVTITPAPLELGVLSIRNVAIGTEVEIPFGDPIDIWVGVGRPERPVEVSLLGFEGSFYLVTEIAGRDQDEGGVVDLDRLEISAETTVQLFGFDVVIAEVAVDLGLAGFFLLDDGDVSFGGSVTLEGVLDVLGLVSVTAGIVGAVTYEVPTETLEVAGTITYAVDTVLTKPKEGSLPLGDVTFALGDGTSSAARLLTAAATGGAAAATTTTTTAASATFGDRFDPEQWLEYAGAFADA